ncbi:MAG: hypothetical protein J6O62_03560 [Bacilli bacterium]|nr:hypothetical protein [Bacilli bacterium]MBO6194918.1 hypothetical protein [Bacilli bacterium]
MKKEIYKKTKIEQFMLIIFIFTLLSLPGAVYFIKAYNIDLPNTTWGFWGWLPIPIISIILGYYFKNSGFNCTKNIISGFVVGILLFVLGFVCFFSPLPEDYNTIDLYKDIIDIKLPKKGELNTMVKNINIDGKRDYKVVNIHYEDKEANNLLESIKNSENWFLGSEIKSILKKYFSKISNIDNNYYYVYNKTTNEYNTLPKELGTYNIYIVEYNVNNKLLRIHEFIYDYK